MRRKLIYGNILQTSTVQFDGHIRDYFVENAQKVVAFYILPRGGNVENFLEVYEKRKLIKKKSLYSPKNIVLAYFAYYFQYLWILFTLFPREEKVFFINHLPVFFFFNSIIRIFRPMEIIYWVADYWPMNDPMIRIFRWFMHYYHDGSRLTLYITDRVNKKMNGRVLNEPGKKTVMLGIALPKADLNKQPGKTLTLCFIGVLVESQGIDLMLSVVAKNNHLNLKLIGTGESGLIDKYKKLIKEYGIERRVYFPNKFYYGQELYDEIKDCHIGIALYTVDKNTVTYFADPAKIKQYAEFGLPIIMTNAAEVAQYIKRFNAGLIVERNLRSVNDAIFEIKNNYSHYLTGLKEFNEYFNYRKYYAKAFKFLENSL